MRVAVLDIGSNSTRLLVADVGASGAVTELARRSTVTRLGAGVDSSGRLSDAGIERVLAALDDYAAVIGALGAVDRRVGVLTSAVRDAANGPDLVAAVTARYGVAARAIDGDEEARLTFLGATSERAPDEPGETLVIDIGGGSTELIVGARGRAGFHVSTQAGVVRQTERHLHDDPPSAKQIAALSAEVDRIVTTAVPERERLSVVRAIAVAGTATSLAAIDQALAPYDPERVHGYRLPLASVEAILGRLARIDNDARRAVAGLERDRAPTIVAGAAMLAQIMRSFDLGEVEVSEHDILRGVALEAAGATPQNAA